MTRSSGHFMHHNQHADDFLTSHSGDSVVRQSLRRVPVLSMAGFVFLLAFSCIGFLTSRVAAATSAPNGPTTGLVSYWQAEGNPSDAVGNNHGTMVAGATYAAGRNGGQAFSLNGAGAYVLIGDPAPASLRVQNEITLSAWIYVTSYPGTDTLGMIVGSQRDQTFSGASIFLDGRTNPDSQIAPAGHIHFQIGDGSWHASNSRTAVPLNQWVHIVATRKANEDARIYYNGIPQPVTSAPWSGAISYNDAWFAIGREKDSSYARPFNGLIDDVKLSNRAVTSEEALELAGLVKNAYAFTTQTGMPLATSIVSNVVAVTGIGSPTTISIINGEYSLSSDGGSSWSNWTASAGTVSPDNLVRLRQTSSTANATATATIFLVGGVSANFFEVTTASITDPAASGLVSWWQAENDGRDSLGVNDLSAGGGSIYGTGKVGQAFSFNRSNFVRNSSTTGLPASGPVTFAAWIKTDAASAHGVNPEVVSVGGDSFCSDGGLHGIVLSQGKFPGISRGCGYGPHFNCTATLDVADNQWHHIVTSWDGSNSSVYVDGALQAQCSGSDYTHSTKNLSIGGRHDEDNVNSPYNGLVDEVKVFNRALSSNEVAKLAGTIPTAGLRLWVSADSGITKEGVNKVSAWADQSGYGFGLAQGNGAKQPLLIANALNGKPALRFDGNDDYVQTPGPINLLGGTAQASYFVVVKPGTTQKQWADIFDYTHAYAVNLVLQQDNTSTNDFWQRLTPTTFQVYSQTFKDRVATTSYLNGSNRKSMLLTQPTAFPEPNFFTIGNKSLEAYPRQFNGDIAEVVFYNTALGDNDRQAVENYLMKKYAIVVAPALVTHWSGEGTAVDSLGGHNGTLVGDAGFAAGKSGQSFRFGGTGGYVEVSDGSFDFGNESFSVDFWMKSNDAGNNTYLVGKSHPDGGLGFDIRLHNSTIQVVGLNGWDFSIVSPAVVAPSRWHHVVLAVANDRATLYINGKPAGSTSRTAISTTANPFRLGYTSNFGGSAFNGLLDEVKIYNYALSAAEAAPQFAGALGYWPADNNVRDLIGGYDGMPMNGASFAPGKLAQALSLDGVDDYVDSGTDDKFNFSGGTGDFTVQAWIKPTAMPPYDAGIITKSGGAPFSGWAFYLYSDGRLAFGGVGVWELTSASGAIRADEWAHVSATKRGSVYKLFKAGVEVATRDYGNLQTSSVPLKFGRAFLTANEDPLGCAASTCSNNGLIDEIKIFQRARSAAEIAADYKATSSAAWTTANGDFEVDAAGTSGSLITGWNLDTYNTNDAGTRGSNPRGTFVSNISAARAYSGMNSFHSFVRNNSGGGGGDADGRHSTSVLISDAPIATSSDRLYLWRSDISYTTSSRWAWRLEVELKDGIHPPQTVLLACRAWGNSEGCAGNQQDSSDQTALGSDGQSWYRHAIPIPGEMNRSSLTVTILHQQDAWDGTTAESSVYFDLLSDEGIDVIPDGFSLPAVGSSLPGVSVESSPITIRGINSATPVTIVGGVYAINGGSFSSASGTVSDGDQVTVRVTSSPTASGVATAMLTVGGISSAFNVTTVPAIYTPDLAAGWSLLGNSLAEPINVTQLFGDADHQTVIRDRIRTVWKWTLTNGTGKWALHVPSLNAVDNASNAVSQGFEVLTTINSKEGYWVNTSEALSLPTQAGTWATYTYANDFANPNSNWTRGFNLIAIGSSMTPTQFNDSFAQSTPRGSEPMTANFVSLWAWDTNQSRWYFYSPSFEVSEALGPLKAFTDSQGFLDFAFTGRFLEVGTGFWVNR